MCTRRQIRQMVGYLVRWTVRPKLTTCPHADEDDESQLRQELGLEDLTETEPRPLDGRSAVVRALLLLPLDNTHTVKCLQ